VNNRGLGQIYLRGKTWWIVYYHRGRRYRESAHSNAPAKAKQLLKTRLAQMGGGHFIGPAEERLMFEDLAELLRVDYRVNRRRSAGKLAYRLARLSEAFAEMRAVDITTHRIKNYIVDRQQAGASNATINRDLAALKRAFTLAVQDRRLTQIPHIPMLAENNARQGFVDHAEYRALRDNLPDHLKDPISFLYLTGWRLGEMQSLEWRDIDLAAQVIRLRPEHSKNQDGREFPFSILPELAEILARQRETRRLDCPLVFHREGKPLGEFRKAWRNAAAKVGLAALLVHDLRRSAVRNLVRAGISEGVAMQLTGHKTRSVFERYNIVSSTDKLNAIQKLASYLNAQPTVPTVIPLASNQRKS
jgi:integrase